MKPFIFLAMLFLGGCSCFRVCPAVPKPPELITPETCYKTLRDTDPIETILRCYIEDIVLLEGAVKERDTALKPYR